MNPSWPATSLVLQLFALLFSNRWVRQWHQQWTAQRAPRPRRVVSGRKAKKKVRRPRHQPARFYERIFSLRVTLWYLIFQRLSFDTTLAGVMADARKGGADRLGKRGTKLSRRIRSAHTASYNEARQRLPVALVQAALETLGQKIQTLVGWTPKDQSPPPVRKRPRQLLDGSTLAMLTNALLAQEYPPAPVRSRLSDWSLMRVVVGFCARSGAVVSAAEGTMAQSEQRLAWQIMAQAARWVIWVADRNFGVWSVVAQAVRFEQDVLVRLTAARARKLMAGRPLRSGQDRAIEWGPSARDQIAPGTERRAIAGRLIYVRLKRGHRWIDLFLFTTLEAKSCPVELLVQWYGQRWQAELHFRSVKTQMRLSQLEVKSPEMARKEFYASLLAYSLVRGVMWGAGANLEKGQQTLSFNNARRVVLEGLKEWGRSLECPKNARRWVRRLLEEVTRQRLPRRRTPLLNQPRMIRCRAKPWPLLKGSRQAARNRCLNASQSL